MMAPLTSLIPHVTSRETADLPEVRLDARVGSGKAVSYGLEREFLIGGAEGCDLRLPGSHLPAVIAQFTRTEAGVSFRRLAPVFPINVNGQQLQDQGAMELNPGDRVNIGPADLVVCINGRGHLRPSFTPINKYESKYSDSTAERVALEKLRANLTQQAQELEADRVAWYRRRQEIEAEVRRLQESVTAGSRQANREQWLSKREADIQAKEAELHQVRGELSDIRESLFAQYEERRQQLEEIQKAAQTASDTIRKQEQTLRTEMAEKQAELDAESRKLQDYVQAEVGRRVEVLETEYRRRAMELEIQHDRKLRELDDDAAQRRLKFSDDISTLEPRLAAIEMEKQQLDRGFRELTYQKEALETERSELNRDWQSRDAEQRWNEERRIEREALLAAREGELSRMAQMNEAERHALNAERDRQADELLRLQTWQSNADERQTALDQRAAEVDLRVTQMARDAAELEEAVKQAEIEQERLTVETDRVERLKLSLDARAAQLAERNSQIEAQQAGLLILRAKIDRHQHEIERETSALASDRARLDSAQAELDTRLRDAEYARAGLPTVDVQHDLDQRAALIDATLVELNNQRDALVQEAERLQIREQELDARSTDMAEQTAVLKAKTTQVIDLQQRLEADRLAVREREEALNAAESARVAFQEQLRKRSEELLSRSKQLDEVASQYSDERVSLNTARQELNLERGRLEQSSSEAREEIAKREAELARQAESIANREQTQERQINRLRAVGQSVAMGRKSLYESRKKWESEQADLLGQSLTIRRELEQFRVQAAREIHELTQQAPDLEDRARFTFEKLSSAREVVRGQLAELHAYASESRETLDAIRTELRNETIRIRDRERELDLARDEHRIAVSEFRQQLHEWQSRVGELKTTMSRNELRIAQRQAELEVVAKKTDETAVVMTRRIDSTKVEPDVIAERRIQSEKHLGDMREWYRKKLHDLATERKEIASTDIVRPGMPRLHNPRELEPGDKQLGELLKNLELVDAESLNDLFFEASRQRRTLRQVLLASGAITLYQMALIEASNLDALMIGRFRVVDRVRVSPREAVYRVFDPSRDVPASGQCILRVLSDSEMHDATHPDEYRQRFALAAGLQHPHITQTWEVLEVHGRPAVVQEWVVGLPSTEWPVAVAMPGVWLKLMIESASALDQAHQNGLVHGRLTPESFVLTHSGSLKVIGFGEPPWLVTGHAENSDPSADLDLLALGNVANAWSLVTGKKKPRGKGLPESLLNVIRKLGSDANGFDDTMAGVAQYQSASELLSELRSLQSKYPCSTEMWAELVDQLVEIMSPPVARRTA